MNTETDEDLGGFERRLLHQLVLHDAARPQQRTRPRSQHRRFGRPAVVAVALVAVVAVGGAATAASYFDDQHDLAVAGTQTYAGGPIYVKGNGCGPGAVVEVALDGTRLGQITADGGGAFNADLIVPAIAGEGSHIVTASCPQADGKGLSQRVTAFPRTGTAGLRHRRLGHPGRRVRGQGRRMRCGRDRHVLDAAADDRAGGSRQ
jgi:hypothetical protein